MRKVFVKIALIFVFSLTTSLHAQVFSLGGKYDKKAMFQAALNVPVLFDNDKPYDVAFGLDYTTPNKNMPSGLQLQVTGMYFLDEGSSKSHLISAGITGGYLLDFNKEFSNQFRLSPHVYAEFGLLTVKAGYDYLLPLQQGTPFVSVGLGGGYLFRHFKIM
ncbi:hypothetical protein SAMN02927937_01780 [Paenimyroides aquimaris]|uniref:Outer membrane protein beta-barrel domain-containing protein n=1 Tax=Paenimyroides marinum TaxID=1159016 RepID=A0A1H6LGH2_9FLAO|nr:hypothetical protein [Paenimyroides aquimaris]SEH85322.1 hypothetical protein SAMN02927937_01780 [Paenimyroides aquimaris]